MFAMAGQTAESIWLNFTWGNSWIRGMIKLNKLYEPGHLYRVIYCHKSQVKIRSISIISLKRSLHLLLFFYFLFILYLFIFYKLKLFQELKWRQLDHNNCQMKCSWRIFSIFTFSVLLLIPLSILNKNVFCIILFNQIGV